MTVPNGQGTGWAVRQLRSTPSVAVAIVITTFLTALLLATSPRLLAKVSNDDLRVTIETAEPEQRNIEVELRGRVDAGQDGPFAAVAARGERFLDEEVPSSVQVVVAKQQSVVTTPRFRISEFPSGDEGPFTTSFRFRYQEGLDEHVTLIEGALPQLGQPAVPTLLGDQCPDDVLDVDGFEPAEDVRCELQMVPVFDTLITAQTADDMLLGIGDRFLLRPDGEDPLWFNASSFQLRHRAIVRISGLVELSDPDLEYWYADTSLHRPRITENADFRLIVGTGIMPDEYSRLLAAYPFVNFAYSWRYFVDPGAFEADHVEALSRDLGKIAPAGSQVTTGLDDLLDEFIQQRRLTVALTSTAIAGLFTAAIGSIVMLSLLLAERQRDATVLIRNRGASRAQLVTSELVRGGVAVVPAATAGWAVAAIAVPRAPLFVGVLWAVVVAIVGLIAFVAAGWPMITRPLGAMQRSAPPTTTSRLRRLVVEGLAVVVAVGAVTLLRRRGSLDEERPSDADFDALLAVAPALIAAAAGLLVIRVAKPLVAIGSWVAARGRGLVGFIGFRRNQALPWSARVPAVVIVVSMGVAVLSSVVHTSIDTGQNAHAWQAVGADHRIESHRRGARLPLALDATMLSDIGEFAVGVEFPTTDVVGPEQQSSRAHVLALDTEAAEGVVRWSDHDRVSFAGIDRGGTTRGDDPIPVIAAGSWPGDERLRVGSEFSLALGRATPTVVVSRVVDRFPSIDPRQFAVIMDIDDLRAHRADLVAVPTMAFVTSDASGPAVDSILADVAPDARVTSRASVLDDLGGDPFARWVDRALLLAVVLSTVFAAAAAVSSLALASSGRRRDLGHLRTLGLRTGQATAITGLEQVPALVVASLGGTVLGLAMARLLAPALDLEAFTGGVLDAAVVTDTKSVALLVAALAAAIAAALVASIAVHRRLDETAILRIGGE